MKYWFGYRVVEFDGSNPGRKCLSEDYETYDLAKKSKDCLRAGDIEFTPIFSAKNSDEAEVQLKSEPFTKL